MLGWLACIYPRRRSVTVSEKQRFLPGYSDAESVSSPFPVWIKGQNYAEFTIPEKDCLWEVCRLDIAPLRPVAPSHMFVCFDFYTEDFPGLPDSRIEARMEIANGFLLGTHDAKITELRELTMTKDGLVVREFSGRGHYAIKYDVQFQTFPRSDMAMCFYVRAYLPDQRPLVAFKHDLFLRPGEGCLNPHRPYR